MSKGCDCDGLSNVESWAKPLMTHQPLKYRALAVAVSLKETCQGYIGCCFVSAMFLYNLSLNPPTAINKAIYGNFSGTKQQEIIVARHTRLELLRPDTTTGKVHTVLAHDCFGLIRSISPFRLTGGSKGEQSCSTFSILKKPLLNPHCSI